MDAEKDIFKPADGCKYPGECGLLGECFEASVINTEINYERADPGSGRVAYQVKKSNL